MNQEIINDLSIEIFSRKIVIIYTSDEKIIIGIGGISKENIEFNSFGIVVKKTGKDIWYSFNDIKKIEVY